MGAATVVLETSGAKPILSMGTVATLTVEFWGSVPAGISTVLPPGTDTVAFWVESTTAACTGKLL